MADTSTITINGTTYNIKDAYAREHLIDIDTSLSQSGEAADAKATGDALAVLSRAVADLAYGSMAITSFSVSPASAELGSTVTSAVLGYVLNKKPTSATLDGDALTITQASGSVSLSDLSLTADKTWTLTATDNQDATATKTTTLHFYNRVYYGAAEAPETINSAFILGLASSVLTGSKARSITVNAGTGKYIWYAVPSRLGDCAFAVGGFAGGFSKAGTVSHTNGSGYTENYDVYRSDNASLGNTAVTVS